MYSACIHCHHPLGANEAIESFPVGRRLAFDAAKGRLWVVCRTCERWNLTPLEERWEAIEACERAFGETRLRVSTDNVGLARLREGTELVRIGAPKRPEMAAWRYGDQFGRRRRKYVVAAGTGVATAAAIIYGAPILSGLVGFSVTGALGTAIWNGLLKPFRREEGPDQEIALTNGASITVSAKDGELTRLIHDGDGVRLLVLTARHDRLVRGRWVRCHDRTTMELRGDDMRRVAGAVLPHINQRGARTPQVQDAVALLEEAPSLDGVFGLVAARAQREFRARTFQNRDEGALLGMSTPLRLALEMAAHEEQERRALEGELAELEEAWRRAEEVAGIADGMFVPATVEERLAGLRADASRGGPH